MHWMMFDLKLSVQIYKMFLFIYSRHMRYRFTNHNSEWSVNFKIDFFSFNLIELQTKLLKHWEKNLHIILCVRWNKELSIILYKRIQMIFPRPQNLPFKRFQSHQFEMVYVRWIGIRGFVDVAVKENMKIYCNNLLIN